MHDGFFRAQHRLCGPHAQRLPAVGVEYTMRKASGEWKIYDISVEGVSLVLTYRPVFDHVTRTEGVDGLVRRLKENARPRPSLTT